MRVVDMRRDVAAALAEAVEAVQAAAAAAKEAMIKTQAIMAQYKAPEEYVHTCTTCGKPGHNSRRHAE